MGTLTTKKKHELSLVYKLFLAYKIGKLGDCNFTLVDISAIGRLSIDHRVMKMKKEAEQLKNLTSAMCRKKRNGPEAKDLKEKLKKRLADIRTEIGDGYFIVKDKCDHKISINPHPKACRYYKVKAGQLVYTREHGFGIIVGVGHNGLTAKNDLWFLFERSRRIVCLSSYGNGGFNEKLAYKIMSD